MSFLNMHNITIWLCDFVAAMHYGDIPIAEIATRKATINGETGYLNSPILYCGVIFENFYNDHILSIIFEQAVITLPTFVNSLSNHVILPFLPTFNPEFHVHVVINFHGYVVINLNVLCNYNYLCYMLYLLFFCIPNYYTCTSTIVFTLLLYGANLNYGVSILLIFYVRTVNDVNVTPVGSRCTPTVAPYLALI